MTGPLAKQEQKEVAINEKGELVVSDEEEASVGHDSFQDKLDIVDAAIKNNDETEQEILDEIDQATAAIDSDQRDIMFEDDSQCDTPRPREITESEIEPKVDEIDENIRNKQEEYSTKQNAAPVSADNDKK